MKILKTNEMKTMRANLILGVLLFATATIFSAHAADPIKGNGKVVTKTVDISDYNEVSAYGSMTFEYEASDKAPYFEVTIDENLFSYLKIEVKGGKLEVGPKQINEGGNWGGNSYNLRPTVFRIKSNSKGLKDINFAGSGRFIANSPLKAASFKANMAGSGRLELKQLLTADNVKINMAGSGSTNLSEVLAEDMDFNMAGSGSLTISKKVKGEKVNLNMAGSGKLSASGVEVQKANCELSSSGNLIVAGIAPEVNCNLAGSGAIQAYNLKGVKGSANISGSGRIELSVSDGLTANVIGSGRVLYKGNPSVTSTKSGSGSVTSAN